MSSTSSSIEPAPGSLAALSLAIFSDLLSNLTHDLVLQSHRAEKLLRTQQHQHALHLSALSSPSSADAANTSNNEPKMPPGNPLNTVPKELFCTRCHLPRHTPETLAMGTITTETGEKKKFCAKLPWQNVRGHDIYGNPFPNPSATVKKGATAKKEQQQGGGAAGDSPSSIIDEAPIKVGKGSGIVYFKCTSCDNEKIASSRYASHLEKCLGLSGRKSSRAAMQKMNSNGGSNSGSPMLAPADAPKGGSRKPSPDKSGVGKAPTPAPDEQASGSITLAIPPPVTKLTPSTAPIAPSTTGTPKKKKKLAIQPGGGTGGIDTKESTPVPSLPPPAIPPPTSSSTTSTGPKEKKRKRKDETSTPADQATKPKKQKPNPTNNTSSSSTTSSTASKPKPKPASSTSQPTLAPSSSTNPASSQPLPKKPPPKPKSSKSKPIPPTTTNTPKKTVPSVSGSGAIVVGGVGGVGGKEGSPKKVKKVVKKPVVGQQQQQQVRPGSVAGKTVPPPLQVAGKTVPGAGWRGRGCRVGMGHKGGCILKGFVREGER
ncbi:hypothetical protein BDD12DRAFT_804821 [Trichophaea hybrida]|nr:hypothetical protein BDD12DRAFT_804821 [Trichophaea hybrida]